MLNKRILRIEEKESRRFFKMFSSFVHQILLVFVFLTCTASLVSSLDHIEQDVTLDGLDNGIAREKRSVQFRSDYDDILNLYWIGDKLSGQVDPVLIVEIDPHGQVDVKTFDDHLFYASKVSDNVRALPRKVSIRPDINLYIFRPDGLIGGRNPSDTVDLKLSHVYEETMEKETIEFKVEKLHGQNKNKNLGEAASASVSGDFTESDEFVTRNRAKSTNSDLHPAVTLLNSRTTAMSVKFKNLSPGCDYYYDDGGDGIYQGRLALGGESTTNTYEGHVFYFTRLGNKDAVLARFKMHTDQVTYVITDPTSVPPRHLQEQADKERMFAKAYRERTGIHWRHYFGADGPRPPPTLHMWGAKSIGQVHSVQSTSGHWMNNCSDRSTSKIYPHESAIPIKQPSYMQSLSAKLFGTSNDLASTALQESTRKYYECQRTETLNFEIEVISLAPRAFIIENFLSHHEADEIVRLSKDKLNESTVGNGDAGGARSDGTRTSKNAWLNRSSNKVIDALFLRAADVLKIDEKQMHNDKNVEDMQVVHYINGQKYDSHHDWGVSGYPESRFITLLLYLTDQPSKSAGGETAFPKAANGGGIKVHAGKGNAVLFYNLLEDGNGDDLALHAALPVKDGHEKWLANFWVWDAKRR